MTIARTVRAIIAHEFDRDPSLLTDDARFIQDLGMDSLDSVELVMSIEEYFGMEIPDDDVWEFEGGIDTVGKLVRYVEGRVVRQAGAL